MVRVKWTDSTLHAGWVKEVDLDLSECASLGFLINLSEDTVAIAMQHSEVSIGEVMVIPTSCVKEIMYLRGLRKA